MQAEKGRIKRKEIKFETSSETLSEDEVRRCEGDRQRSERGEVKREWRQMEEEQWDSKQLH